MGIACSWSCCIDGFHRCSGPSLSSDRRPWCVGIGPAFAIIRLARRDLVWINVTTHPTADWIAHQITEAFPWAEAPRLIRDRDCVYGAAVTHRLRTMGIRDK